MTGLSRTEALNARFAPGVQFTNYGSVPQTDFSGNINGEFRPVDYVACRPAPAGTIHEQMAFLRRIHQIHPLFLWGSTGRPRPCHWISASAITIRHHYGRHLLWLSIMGAQSDGICRIGKEEITSVRPATGYLQKRLANAPLQFSITATGICTGSISGMKTRHSMRRMVLNKMEKERIFSSTNCFKNALWSAPSAMLRTRSNGASGTIICAGKQPNMGSRGNGLNGFSLGAGALFRKLQIRYARSWYQRTIGSSSNHNFGLSLRLNDYLGSGKWWKSVPYTFPLSRPYHISLTWLKLMASNSVFSPIWMNFWFVTLIYLFHD